MAKPLLTQQRKLMTLLVGDNWRVLEEYLAVEKDRLVTRLFKCREDELKSIQGELEAIHKLLNMPSKLKQESNSR